jgi:hypothetical protein
MQLRHEEWRGTRHVVGSDAMPASAKMPADDAQYDKPLRGALLHTEGPLVAGIRTADDEIIRGGGQARRPDHGAWVVPGAAASSPIPGHFRAVWLRRAFSRIPAQRLAPKASDRVGGLAGVGSLSLNFLPRGGRKASDEGGQ